MTLEKIYPYIHTPDTGWRGTHYVVTMRRKGGTEHETT